MIFKNLNKNLHLMIKWIKLIQGKIYFFNEFDKCKQKQTHYYWVLILCQIID